MDESQFMTEIRHSFADKGSFAYKIPDSANMVGKFSVSKPFDMIAEVEGTFTAIEGKMQKDGNAWSVRSLRDTQKLGLAKVERFGNRAYVFVCWKESRGKYYCVIIPNKVLYGRKSFTKKQLLDWPYKILRDNKKERYDLTEFFRWFKMGI